jgi:cytochrome b561
VPLRNGAHGYGGVTKALHWTTVSALLGQFLVGLSMDWDDEGGHGSGHGRGSEGSGHSREDGYALFQDGFGLPELHVLLGATVLALGVTRVLWRRVGGLPPWAPALSATERRVEGLVEKALLTALFAVPLTGLGLLLSGEDDLLPLHVAAQLLLLTALAVHLGLVARHTLVRRDRLLSRML